MDNEVTPPQQMSRGESSLKGSAQTDFGPEGYKPMFSACIEEEVRRFRQLFDLIPDYLYVIDWDARFRLANKAVGEAHGWEVADVVGRLYSEVDKDEKQAAMILSRCRETMIKKVPRLTEEMPFRRSDGVEQTLRLYEVPFEDPITREPMLLGLAVDITAQKRLEAELLERKKLQRDLQVARDIQQGLLPNDIPVCCGFEIAGWSEPAEQTGGDYYDWIPLPDGRTLITLADVTGHGLGPAIIMAGCRAYARAIFRRHATLSECFARLNQLLSEELTNGRFVTFAAAALDTQRGVVELLSAGHGPQFHYLVERNDIAMYDSDGPPLGVLPDMRFNAGKSVKLQIGEALAIVSDGLYEVFNKRGEMFGVDRLAQIIKASARKVPSEVIASLRNAVAEFSATTSYTDDMTVVVIKRGPRS